MSPAVLDSMRTALSSTAATRGALAALRMNPALIEGVTRPLHTAMRESVAQALRANNDALRESLLRARNEALSNLQQVRLSFETVRAAQLGIRIDVATRNLLLAAAARVDAGTPPTAEVAAMEAQTAVIEAAEPAPATDEFDLMGVYQRLPRANRRALQVGLVNLAIQVGETIADLADGEPEEPMWRLIRVLVALWLVYVAMANGIDALEEKANRKEVDRRIDAARA